MSEKKTFTKKSEVQPKSRPSSTKKESALKSVVKSEKFPKEKKNSVKKSTIKKET